MEQSKDNKFIPMTSVESGSVTEVAEDVCYYTNQIVNLVMLGKPGQPWVLVDAGMPKSGAEILEVAEQRFGKGSKPECIVLTHGHFDHVGGLTYLLEHWQVPVFAHRLEFPFLNGSLPYPEPDPSVEGGVLAKISSIYPHEPANVSEYLHEIPQDGKIPVLADWRWIETPGHSPGHVSLYREADGILISGDAVITVRQDSLYKVLIQKKEVNGPPRYLTTDWKEAFRSAQKIQMLHPQIMIPGHGKYMSGPELQDGLSELVLHFETMAVPEYGKYVSDGTSGLEQ